MKKLLFSLLSIIVISICAAFNVPARAPAQPVSLQLKQEFAGARYIANGRQVSIFTEADCLVMYEPHREPTLRAYARLRFLEKDEKIRVKFWANSKYFRTKPEFYRKIRLDIS